VLDRHPARAYPPPLAARLVAASRHSFAKSPARLLGSDAAWGGGDLFADDFCWWPGPSRRLKAGRSSS